jgi:hypothetical protein
LQSTILHQNRSFLSGGIGLEEIAAVNEITKTNLPFMPLM